MSQPKSNPPKPDGNTPTPIPFSMSSDLTNNNGTDNFNYANSLLDLNFPILIDRFNIDSASPSGTFLYNWTSDHPLGTSLYNGFTNCPYNLVKPMFSRLLSYELELIFVPVKVSDSRAILGVFFDYALRPSTIVANNPDSYNSDNAEFVISQSLEQQTLEVPLYWPSDFVPSKTFNGTYPQFAPKTSVRVYLKEKFVPNLIQPPTFPVLVFLKIKNIKAIGLATETRNVNSPATNLNWVFN